MKYLKTGLQLLVAVAVIAALLFLSGLLVKVVWKLFLAGFNLW
jgi:hypothetical protein